MNRINELEKNCPEVAERINELINMLASHNNTFKNNNLSYEYVERMIKETRYKLESDIKSVSFN